ncbi:MAG TPA: type II secretion system F family protein [Acidobacteriota bacterium]|nr:type II secretion system F family protein [Acidobacteriota bacterium]
MPVYTYRGRNVRTNAAVAGERFSNSPQALTAVLRKEQITATAIQEKKKAGFRLTFGRLVSQAEIGIFTRQFSVMLDAGLPLVQCIEAIGQQHTNLAFKSVLEQVRTDVEAGSTLSDAMSKHPRVFDSLYTNMIAAGEAGGILDTILQRLAIFIEKLVKLKSAVRSAMIYPTTIMTIAVGVVTIILWKVVPVFRTLFAGFNVELPLLTRVVIGLSNFVSGYAFFILIVLAIVLFGLRNYYKTDKGRHVIDRMLLKMPILGDVFRKVGVARFTRTLATLLSSGVPILDGLDITAKTSGNAILEDVLYRVRRNIEEGKTMSEPMRESGFFPPMVTQMVSVGESTGELDTMLVKVADYYEDEVDTIMANLLTILEPVMLVFLGVVVGGIVIAMYMPLFKLIEVLSGG